MAHAPTAYVQSRIDLAITHGRLYALINEAGAQQIAEAQTAAKLRDLGAWYKDQALEPDWEKRALGTMLEYAARAWDRATKASRH